MKICSQVRSKLEADFVRPYKDLVSLCEQQNVAICLNFDVPVGEASRQAGLSRRCGREPY